MALESRAFGRLRELAIVKRCHLSGKEIIKVGDEQKREEGEDEDRPTDLYEDGLDAVGAMPVGENG